MVKNGIKEDEIMNIILFQKNVVLLIIIIIAHTAITTFIQNKIVIQILNFEKTNFKKIWVLKTIIFTLIRILTPTYFHKILEVIVQTILYKQYLKITIEKALLATEVNVIIFSITELFVFKIFTELFKVKSMLITNSLMPFLISVVFAIITIKLVTYAIIKKAKVKIYIPEVLSSYSKMQIIEVASVSILLTVIDQTLVLAWLDNLPNSIYFLDIILLFSYSLISTISIIKTIQIEKDKNEINNLESNNDRLQNNYDSISSFRHDFGNIMQGIGGYIATKDLDGLQKMYNDVVCECQEINNIKAFDLEVINNPAIYNLINNKYLIARKNNVKINVDVYIDLNSLQIKTYELCRILGILIDNAIEASKDCQEKIVNIKFIKDNYYNRNIIVIENTCKNYLLDLSKLKEKGFTTKKNKLLHGLGLWKVNQIINKHENLKLVTSRDKTFKQQLEIYSWK